MRFAICGKTSKTVVERVNAHLKNARYGVDYYVYRWIRKTGEENIGVLELPLPFGVTDDAIAEKFWIAHLRERGCRLTNLTAGGEGVTGLIHTPETRAKISAAVRRQPPEWFAKKGEANRGRKHSAETRAKMSAARRGRPKSPEHAAKIGASNRGRLKGTTHSPERRAKQSAAQRGHIVSIETRAKISAAHKARIAAARGGSLVLEQQG